MNNNEENNYKEYAKETTPDLWSKIEDNLPDGMYTKDSSSENQTPKNENKIVKFPKRKIYTIAGIVAACLVILTIPYITASNTNVMKSSNNSRVDSIDSNYSLADNDQEISNSSNIDSNTSKNSITDDSSNNINDNTTSNNESPENAVNNSNPQEETDMNPTITLKVTKHHTTDIGLVYEGIIIDTSSSTINKDDTVYVTLRKLTRHDLLHTYEPNEKFTISLYDDTFTSSPSNPYYALKKIK